MATSAGVGPHTSGVRFPPLAQIDTGVLHLTGPAATHGGLPPRPSFAPDGLRYTVDSCQLGALGSWVVRGHVRLPGGAHDVGTVLAPQLSQGDLGYGSAFVRGTFA